MEKEQLEKRLKELQQEHQKGVNLIEETRVKVLRIEGAMIQIQELLKVIGDEVKQKAVSK